VHSCIFACDAVNLILSCSLLVFMIKSFLLLTKSTQIVAAQSCTFGSDINQIVRRLELRPIPYSAPPYPLAVFKGLTSKGNKGGEEGRGREERIERKGRRRKGEEVRLSR